MKKLIMMLLALMLCMPVWAETADVALDPFAVAVPEGTTIEEGTGGASQVFVHENGTTRAVAMVISRVPDLESDHDAELRRLMVQFAPQSRSAASVELLAGFHGLKAVTPGAMEGLNGQRVDQVTFMVLWQTALRGELLIISGYDMAGDTKLVEDYILQLLTGTTVNDAPIMPEQAVE